MVKKVLLGLVGFLALFAIAASLQPADFRVSRSIVIAAAPADVFVQLNDFHRWEQWSPWAKMDPTMKTSYEGPSEGPGAMYSWAGDSKVGEGKMTILNSQSPERVVIQLDFLKPMQATNTTEFTLQPQDQGTFVTWSMTGKNNFMSKAIHMVMSLDKMVGPDFEKGLAQLKTVVEGSKP